MRILITGGAGFIGTNIAKEALHRGHDVIAMDSFIRPGTENNIPILKDFGAEVLRGDVREMVDFQRSPVPDAIIHLAANPGIPWSIQWPSYDFEVNARGTVNVLEYSRVMGQQLKKKIPVIFASTNKVYTDLINEIPWFERETRFEWIRKMIHKDTHYDSLKARMELGWTDLGINENFPVDGFGEYHHSPYGASKLAADQYMQEYHHQYGIPTVINRMSCIYGLYQQGVQDQGWVDHFVRTAVVGDRKLNFFGNGKQVRDMLWGGDVAKLYLDELERIDEVAGEVFNVGGGVDNTLSLLEAIELIQELAGMEFEIEYHDWRPADQKIYISDISKVKEMVGWEPEVSPKEGLRRLVEFYEKE